MKNKQTRLSLEIKRRTPG